MEPKIAGEGLCTLVFFTRRFLDGDGGYWREAGVFGEFDTFYFLTGRGRLTTFAAQPRLPNAPVLLQAWPSLVARALERNA